MTDEAKEREAFEAWMSEQTWPAGNGAGHEMCWRTWQAARLRQGPQPAPEGWKLVPARQLNRLTHFLGIAHCRGYKCRLPHCDSCNDEDAARKAEQEMWDVLHDVLNASPHPEQPDKEPT